MGDIFDDIEAREKSAQTGNQGPDIFDRLEAKDKSSEPILTKASNLAARFGHQVWNKGVVDTLQYLRQHSEVGKMFQDAEELSLIQDAKKSGKPVDYDAIKQLAKSNMEASAERNIPHAQITPAAGTAEQVMDVGAGITAFMGQLAILKKAIPGLSEPLLWEVQNQINGGRPGAGAINQIVFKGLDKVPGGKTLLGKVGSMTVQTSGMYGISRAQGATDEEAKIMAAVPLGFRGLAGIKAALAPKIGPYAGGGPDIVRQGRTISPEVPQAVGAEGVIPQEGALPETIGGKPGQPGQPRRSLDLELQQTAMPPQHADLPDKYTAELQAKHEAYVNLLDAIGSGDGDKIAAARDVYAQAGPPTHAQVLEASDAGDPEAHVRLNNGYFQLDKVDTASPLTAQERSRAKRMGYSKDLTKEGGTMTPGQVRMMLRGDQGVANEPADTSPEGIPEKGPAEAELNGRPVPVASDKDKNITSPEFEADKAEAILRTSQIKTKKDKRGRTEINVKASPRYSAGDLEAEAGRPLGTWIMQASDRIDRAGKDAQLRVMGGLDLNNLKYPTPESAQKIADAVHSGDYNNLTSEERPLAEATNHILQTEGARLNARHKWKNWKEDIETPGGLEGDEAKQVFEAGQAAEKAGRLDEWLAEQPGFTREHYFMSEDDPHNENRLIDSILRGEKPDPKLVPGTSKIRERNTRALRTTNPILDAVNHVIHLARLDAARDDVTGIMSASKKMNLSHKAQTALADFFKTAIGTYEPLIGPPASARLGQGIFWTLKMADPSWRIGRFAPLQYMQYMYAKTQMSMSALLKGTWHLFEKADPDAIRHIEEHYGSRSKQPQRDMELLRKMDYGWRNEHPELAKMNAGLFKTMRAINAVGGDSYCQSRNAVYRAFYTPSKYYLQKYYNGKMTWAQFEAKVQLKSLHPGSQTQDIYWRIQKGHLDKAADMIAYAKTLNVHDPYDPRLYPFGLQKPASRLLTGPRTWVRSIWEMTYRQGFRLIQDGIKNKDASLTGRGVSNVLAVLTCLYLQDKIREKITGRKRFPLSDLIISRCPGADLIWGMSDTVRQTLAASQTAQETKGQTANRLAGALSKQVEYAIPFVSGIANMYESQHDAEHVSLWNLVEAKLNLTRQANSQLHKKWHKAERTPTEAWLHILTGGGFEEGERKQEQRALRQKMRSI